MKKQTLSITILGMIMLIFSIVSCSKNSETNSNDLNFESISSFSDVAFATAVRITCPGCSSSGCNAVMSKDGGKWYTECDYGCGQCSMVLETSKLYYNSSTVETEISHQSRYEVHFYEAFLEYTEENYPDEDVSISEIEITIDPLHNTYAILYVYNIGDRVSSVMFTKTEASAVRIDCTGSCDCRERYYHGTGATECTCSPCHMDIKEIKASLY